MTVDLEARPHRLWPKQHRLDFEGVWQPPTREIEQIASEVRRSGIVPILNERLRRRSDGMASLSVLGYETALHLHGSRRHHEMHLIEVVRLINSFDEETLNRLAMPAWHFVGCYDRFQRLHSRLNAALDEGWLYCDVATGELITVDRLWYEFCTETIAVDLALLRGCALAIDGTDMPTWGRLHGEVEAVELDGAAVRPDEDEEDAA